MIHFVDNPSDFERISSGEIFDYAQELKQAGKIRHLGLSSHDPVAGRLAVESGLFDVILFSVNPAFDMLPSGMEIMSMFEDTSYSDRTLGGLNRERDEFYRLCERENVGLTVMKAFCAGRLLSAETSPFGIAMTPVQCIHYALTRPAVASVMVGYDTPEQVDEAVAYETASPEERDFAKILAEAPKHAFGEQCTYCGHCVPCPSKIDVAMVNKLYDLASLGRNVPPSVRYIIVRLKPTPPIVSNAVNVKNVVRSGFGLSTECDRHVACSIRKNNLL